MDHKGNIEKGGKLADLIYDAAMAEEEPIVVQVGLGVAISSILRELTVDPHEALKQLFDSIETLLRIKDQQDKEESNDM